MNNTKKNINNKKGKKLGDPFQVNQVHTHSKSPWQRDRQQRHLTIVIDILTKPIRTCTHIKFPPADKQFNRLTAAAALR